MRSSFFGLNIAMSGLYTAQRNLDVVNHNINNATTPGFSRQRAVQTAARALPLYDGSGMIGTGSNITEVKRFRDEYADFKYWNESIAMGEWDTKRTLMAELEATFNEPSSSGFTKVIDEYFSAFQELSKDPSSLATRTLVMQRGVSTAKYFNNLANNFENSQSDINFRVKTKVEEVNSYAVQIQNLNKQIYMAELDGNTANDLRDRRTLLVDSLSAVINIEAYEVVAGKLPNGQDDKHFQILISGKTLVDHFDVSRLNAQKRVDKVNEEDIEGLYEVGWEDGNTVNIKGGELKGLLDIRDGNEGTNGSPLYKGIPFYLKKMNQFARTFAMAINEGYIDHNNDGVIAPSEDKLGHADGYGLNSVAGDPPSGIRFFTLQDGLGNLTSSASFINGAITSSDIYDRYKSITAKNLAVSMDISKDTNLISVSDTPGQKGNGNMIGTILNMRNDTHMFAEGGPEDFMKSLVATIGIDSQQTIRFAENQKAILTQVENRRLSESGVSIDEEMANLVKYQHSYNAAAKMITTMAEIYDTLINRTGNV